MQWNHLSICCSNEISPRARFAPSRASTAMAAPRVCSSLVIATAPQLSFEAAVAPTCRCVACAFVSHQISLAHLPRHQGRMSLTSVSERTSTGSYVSLTSVASTSSEGGAAPAQSDASAGSKQPLTEAERRRRRGPNYKPLDEIRLFGKVVSTAIQSVLPDALKSKLPHYFRKGNAFAVANGAHRSFGNVTQNCFCLSCIVCHSCTLCCCTRSHESTHTSRRATVEREIYDVIRPIVFQAFTPPAVLASRNCQPSLTASHHHCSHRHHHLHLVLLVTYNASTHPCSQPTKANSRVFSLKYGGRHRRACRVRSSSATRDLAAIWLWLC